MKPDRIHNRTAVKRVCRGYFPLIHIVFSAPLAWRRFPRILGGEGGLIQEKEVACPPQISIYLSIYLSFYLFYLFGGIGFFNKEDSTRNTYLPFLATLA
jgi:hypothetical protein